MTEAKTDMIEIEAVIDIEMTAETVIETVIVEIVIEIVDRSIAQHHAISARKPLILNQAYLLRVKFD